MESKTENRRRLDKAVIECSLPACDLECEYGVLGLLMSGGDLAKTVLSLAQDGDFYSEELREFYRQAVAMSKATGADKDKRWDALKRRAVELRIPKRAADEQGAMELCRRLRQLRRERRIALASETIFTADKSIGWVEVAERELSAVKAIPGMRN